MQITTASVLDLNALSKLEKACFEKDLWPILDLIAVLTYPDIVRLKVVENGRMIGFVAGDMRLSEGLSWIATIGIAPEYRRRGIGRELLSLRRQQDSASALRARVFERRRIRLYEQEAISGSSSGRHTTTMGKQPLSWRSSGPHESYAKGHAISWRVQQRMVR
jgi:ribosomal protein S18 acetylase RimI-like enzyme